MIYLLFTLEDLWNPPDLTNLDKWESIFSLLLVQNYNKDRI